MNYNKRKKNIPYKDLIYKLSLFIITVTVIVYFLPREVTFSYQFDTDKPWKYSQLMATFDFPVYKEEGVVKLEQDSLMRSFKPYFNLSPDAKGEALSRLKKRYQSTYKKIFPSSDYLQYLEQTIGGIYDRGIISNNNYLMLEKDGTSSIWIVENRASQTELVSKLLTAKQAYEYLLNSDSTYYKPEVLRQCNLSELITPNLTYDAERTQTAREDILRNYSWSSGMIVSGQKIIDRGEIVTPEKYLILESLRKESLQRAETSTQKRLTLIGQILLVSAFIALLITYIKLFRVDFFKDKKSLLLLFSLIVIFCVSASLISRSGIINIYILPFCILPIMARVFLDSRTAFLSFIVAILICSINLLLPQEFILVQVAAGMVGIFSLRELSQRSQLFRTALIVTATYTLLYFAYELIIINEFSKMNGRMYFYFIINGVLLLFTYPLLYLVEKVFGFTSNVTLVELSNINNDLLRQMAETVPGTFQHSMQVSNLAAEAANRIGAKSQLVRTGAHYHYSGKMENPAFFTGNQSGGINPHNKLSYEQSAQVVINHITDGLKLADKHNLPQVIKDFINTHHGHGKTQYFLISWMNEHPG